MADALASSGVRLDRRAGEAEAAPWVLEEQP